MRPVALAAALMLLAACDQRSPDAAPADLPMPEQTASMPSAPVPASTPSAPTGAAATLAFRDASGNLILRLDCSATAPRFKVSAPRFNPVASEDRLSVGGEGEAYAFAADLNAAGPGVTASGDIDLGLIRTVADGEPIQALYGQQATGPLIPPSQAERTAFAVACGHPPVG